MAFPIVGVLIASVILAWFIHQRKKKKHCKVDNLKEIPGPKGLPLIGNVLQLGKFPNDTFTKWSKEYGPIYKVRLGSHIAVIVSDPKLSKEIFTNDPAFAGRPHFDITNLYEENPRLGMFVSEGDLWEIHRNFLIRQLRTFGFGKSSMEALIMEDVNEVLNKLKKEEGKPIGNIRGMLRLAIVNALWTILSSQRFKHDDPKLGQLVHSIVKVFDDVFGGGTLLIFLPWLRHVFPEGSGYNAARRVLEGWKTFLEGTVKEHKEQFHEGNLKDFIDVYLAEVRKTTDKKSYFYGQLGERQLVSTMLDLFIAGSDTSATTLSWTLVYLCKFPHVQKKLQVEIESVTGNERQVSVDDRPMMPYAQALVDEILRYSSIVPDGAQHRATEEREFQGYRIPKDAWIQPNLYYIHHDPKIWGDPQNFRPERFLSENGKKYMKNENLQPFQIGRRICVGENLARDNIFLFMTNIFQKFEVRFDPKSKEPGLGTLMGFFRNPEDYS
ncbi:Methyl farnesoate epoxidase [Orchesella cincta]|uniref:Methyl farnesoate epoxidase n=1 Tax=Orchesella cincta TaxID=48709 RepID=A0A1D2M979_ORCCI|nr:Methyl farnesoate epoxidase [Orchesella cincta]